MTTTQMPVRVAQSDPDVELLRHLGIRPSTDTHPLDWRAKLAAVHDRLDGVVREEQAAQTEVEELIAERDQEAEDAA